MPARVGCEGCCSICTYGAGRLGGSRGVLRKGGLLVVSSTWDWSERVADRQLWLGGSRDAAGAAVK